MKANTKKSLSLIRAEKKAIELIEVAQNSYPAIKPTDVRCDQVKDYAICIAELKEKKEALVQQMTELSKERQEYHVLRSISGVGDSTACRLIGEIGDIRRF